MCSAYWNLNATIDCPGCGVIYEGDYQTHAGGEGGACLEWFNVGDKVPYLTGFTGRLSEFDGDGFIEIHDKFHGGCDAVFNVDADVRDGIVIAVDRPQLWCQLGRDIELRPRRSVASDPTKEPGRGGP